MSWLGYCLDVSQTKGPDQFKWKANTEVFMGGLGGNTAAAEIKVW